MRVIIGCEFSQTVCAAFRARGHEAFSCDLLQTEGNRAWHVQCDIETMLTHRLCWDLIILHLPCTKIALCGNSTYGKGMPKHAERLEAIEWTAKMWNRAKWVCKRVAFENPKNVMGPVIGKRTQSIQPYEYGHLERKETWLWLHGLPKLVGPLNVYEEMMKLPKKQRERIHYMSPSADRGKERARFFTGWASAMAEQWGNL